MTYNGWTNYATRAVATRCESVQDVEYRKESVEEKQEELSQDGHLFGDLFCNQPINWDELRESFESDE